MMVSLKRFALKHPKIVVGITMLVILLLANPAVAPEFPTVVL